MRPTDSLARQLLDLLLLSRIRVFRTTALMLFHWSLVAGSAVGEFTQPSGRRDAQPAAAPQDAAGPGARCLLLRHPRARVQHPCARRLHLEQELVARPGRGGSRD